MLHVSCRFWCNSLKNTFWMCHVPGQYMLSLCSAKFPFRLGDHFYLESAKFRLWKCCLVVLVIAVKWNKILVHHCALYNISTCKCYTEFFLIRKIFRRVGLLVRKAHSMKRWNLQTPKAVYCGSFIIFVIRWTLLNRYDNEWKMLCMFNILNPMVKWFYSYIQLNGFDSGADVVQQMPQLLNKCFYQTQLLPVQ